MSYAPDGSLNVTVVDGTTYTGLYASDGSWNVIEEGAQGLYHPCGAYRVTIVDGSTFTGIQAADGSWNATNAETDSERGFQHPCGAIRMTGLFSPLQLSPFIWLDPSDLSTLFQDSGMTTPVTTDGDIVGAILDKSGNGHHLTQAFINNKPLYHTSGGLHWLEFDGVDDFLATVSPISIAQPIEFVSAWRRLGAQAEPRSLFGSDNSGSPEYSFESGGLGLFAGAFLDGPTFPTSGTDFVATCRFNGASSRVALDNAAYVTGDAGANGYNGLIYIARHRDAGREFNARFAGSTIFDRLLTDPEIAQLRTYLAAKQGRVL